MLRGLSDPLRGPSFLPRDTSDLPRGPLRPVQEPSVLAMGPFDVFRGPSDPLWGPFYFPRGPSDLPRDPYELSRALCAD